GVAGQNVIELDPAGGGEDGTSFALQQSAAELQDKRVIVEDQHRDILQLGRHQYVLPSTTVCLERFRCMIHFPGAATTWTNSISPSRRPLCRRSIRRPNLPQTPFRSAARPTTTRRRTAISGRCFRSGFRSDADGHRSSSSYCCSSP